MVEQIVIEALNAIEKAINKCSEVLDNHKAAIEALDKRVRALESGKV